MKHQAIFSSKDKSKKNRCRLLQIFIGALTVKWKCPNWYFYANEKVSKENLAASVFLIYSVSWHCRDKFH